MAQKTFLPILSIDRPLKQQSNFGVNPRLKLLMHIWLRSIIYLFPLRI